MVENGWNRTSAEDNTASLWRPWGSCWRQRHTWAGMCRLFAGFSGWTVSGDSVKFDLQVVLLHKKRVGNRETLPLLLKWATHVGRGNARSGVREVSAIDDIFSAMGKNLLRLLRRNLISLLPAHREKIRRVELLEIDTLAQHHLVYKVTGGA